MPQRLFRVIVRGRYAGVAEEGEEEFLLGSGEISPEGLGGFETKRRFADIPQFRREGGRCCIRCIALDKEFCAGEGKRGKYVTQ